MCSTVPSAQETTPSDTNGTISSGSNRSFLTSRVVRWRTESPSPGASAQSTISHLCNHCDKSKSGALGFNKTTSSSSEWATTLRTNPPGPQRPPMGHSIPVDELPHLPGDSQMTCLADNRICPSSLSVLTSHAVP